MNRRQFTRNIAALLALPALPVKALSSAAAVPSIPAAAQYWAQYMTSLHGTCTPGMLQNVLRVSGPQAQAISARLVAGNVLTPAQTIARKTALQSNSGTDRYNRFLKKLRNMDGTESVADANSDELAQPDEESTNGLNTS